MTRAGYRERERKVRPPFKYPGTHLWAFHTFRTLSRSLAGIKKGWTFACCFHSLPSNTFDYREPLSLGKNERPEERERETLTHAERESIFVLLAPSGASWRHYQVRGRRNRHVAALAPSGVAAKNCADFPGRMDPIHCSVLNHQLGFIFLERAYLSQPKRLTKELITDRNGPKVFSNRFRRPDLATFSQATQNMKLLPGLRYLAALVSPVKRQ